MSPPHAANGSAPCSRVQNRNPGRAAALTVLLPGACAAVLFLLFPGMCADGVRAGLSLCARAVIPSLFPFMVLTPLLTDGVKTLFRGAQAQTAALTAAFLLGLLTGFPLGAAAVCGFYSDGMLTREQAERAVGVCSGAGPAFLVGYAGKALSGSAAAGWGFLMMQLIASLAAALLFLSGLPADGRTADGIQDPVRRVTVPDAVRIGTENLLTVCGFVVFFSVLRGLLSRGAMLLGIPRTAAAVLCGMLELTGGLSDLAAALPDTPALRMPLSALLIGCGGLCAALQVGSFAGRAGLSMRRYLSEKLLCGLLCAALAAVFRLF